MKTDARLILLIEGYMNRRLDEAELFELEEYLTNSRENREVFLRHAEIEGLLHEWGRGKPGFAGSAICGKPEKPMHILRYVVGIAAALALGFFLWNQIPFPAGSGNRDTVLNATLIHQEEAVWPPSVNPPTTGMPVHTGNLSLSSGRIAMNFPTGATMVLAGPSEITPLGGNALSCKRGRMTWFSPATSQEFRVETPVATIDNLRGQIAIAINESSFDLLTQKGSATIRWQHGGTVSVGPDEALHCTLDGAVPDDTESMDQCMRQIRDDRSFLSRAPGSASAISPGQDPDLLLHYTFDDVNTMESRVPNHSSYRGTLDGTMQNATLVDGRKPGSKAVQLRQQSSAVRFSVPGTYQTITMAAWVRVEKMENNYNGIFMSDGIKPGGFHWHVRGNGCMEAGILDGPAPSYLSETVFTGNTMDSWQHIAIVYDLPGNSISHYFNGKLTAKHNLSAHRLVRIRAASIGNWNPADDWDPYMIRNFTGAIDDFSIYQRALPEADILRLYQNEK